MGQHSRGQHAFSHRAAIFLVFFDAAGFIFARRAFGRDLHTAAFYALLLGALASFAAVLSGLIISGWQFYGGGKLAKHHLFVWPAFGLLIGLSVWRIIVRDTASRPSMAAYLAAALLATGLMLAAGYWGGELSMSD